jgi:hypothetical protein
MEKTKMKRLLATTAVFVTLASPAFSYTSEADALADIASSCEAKWGTNFDMQVFCRKNQTEAYYKLYPKAPCCAPPSPPPIQQNYPCCNPISLPPSRSPQVNNPEAPPTLPTPNLGPLSVRLNEINQLVRQSLPIITRHCGADANCRKEQTAAMHELADRETAIAKALRNPTTYITAVMQNDAVNACKVMWVASEDFAGLMQCINDATATATAPTSNKPVS